MHFKDSGAPPSEVRINPVTELIWQLGGVEKGHSMYRELRGCWRRFFSNQT